ncbi:hypothetical protein M8C21_005243, partial [Ambrosia artemisiifolia]
GSQSSISGGATWFVNRLKVKFRELKKTHEDFVVWEDENQPVSLFLEISDIVVADHDVVYV